MNQVLTADSEMFDEMVRIIVGEQQKRFEVHKGVITFYSGYFDKAFNGGFAEAAAKEVVLKAEDPKIVDFVRYWIYRQRFTPHTGELETKKLGLTDIAKLWIFGDAHEIPMLPECSDGSVHQEDRGRMDCTISRRSAYL